MKHLLTLLLALFSLLPRTANSQNLSVAYKWNNLILEAIRNDYARPTVHARNLYHHSIICYDAWAAYDPSRERFFLGKTLHNYMCAFDSISIPANIQAAREETIAFASYRFIENRYSSSPDYALTMILVNDLMNQLGYDPSNTSTDYVNGGPAELGNYLAEQIQLYGYTDGSNEQGNFANLYYDQQNPPIDMSLPGNPDIQDPNHWQPLNLPVTIDQSGNVISSTQPHLSPEWGEVDPFSLDTSMYTELTRDGDTYKVYFDSLHPAFLNLNDSAAWDSFYKWNHSLVCLWQSHLDTSDNVMWDISPASVGNNTWYPTDSSEFPLFYDLLNGGDPSTGYAVNPVTGQPYTPQIVHRADYARVLAEFWADGLDSETPPGHWFEIYHYVMQQPTFERKWKGVGPVLDPLEYDVKAHLTLGGTVHDAAICSWSLKGYYDYIRPVSAIRYMADQGQSSDTNELSYDPNGIPLLPGFIEVVHTGDSLAGQWNEHVGKIKVYTWRGHDYINDPLVDDAGVGWILAENWWPYQRPTFVTPPFAGFVSGHSTFSRAAARTMGFITGSPYFPGGMGEFIAPMNEYLQFEEGPSDTVRLQWASYIDASDQCSLSRIWGGIHPPIDDMPGRRIGDVVGPLASQFADSIFSTLHPALIASSCSDSLINTADIGGQFTMDFTFNVAMDISISPNVSLVTPGLSTAVSIQQIVWLDSFNLQVTLDVLNSSIEINTTKVTLDNLIMGTGSTLASYAFLDYFIVDTKLPLVTSITSSIATVSDPTVPMGMTLSIFFDEPCDTADAPAIAFSGTNYVNPTLTENTTLSGWMDSSTYVMSYDLTDYDEFVTNISVDVTGVADSHENTMAPHTAQAPFDIDTENPTIISATASDTLINQADISGAFWVDVVFSEAMDTTVVPALSFLDQGTTYTSLVQTTAQTTWTDTHTVHAQFQVLTNTNDLIPLDLDVANVSDEKGNVPVNTVEMNVVWSDLKSPEVVSRLANKPIISDSVVGAANYFVDITFSEAMDTTVTPFVSLTASQSISGDVQYNVPASSFLDSFTYRTYFQVFDLSTEVSPVHLTVNFGKDFAGNTQLVDDALGFTSIDTKNPTVVDIFANDYILDEWGQPFDVVVIYDEAMRTDVHPALSFSPIVPVPFPKVDSAWLNSSNYALYYQLQGSPVQSTIFDISLINGVDLAGNLQNPLGQASYFQIDPVLALEALESSQALLYPTILASGDHLTIAFLENSANTLNFSLINALGQQVSMLAFEKSGDRWVSGPVHIPSGWYYLQHGTTQFKIVMQ